MNGQNMHPRSSASVNGLLSALTMPFVESVMDNLDPMFAPNEGPTLCGSVPFLADGKYRPIAVPMPVTAAVIHTLPGPMDSVQAGAETAVPPPAANKAVLPSSQYSRQSMPDISAVSSSSSSSSPAADRRRRRTVSHIATPEDEEQQRLMLLERNRQAALKCRLRKKQWLANLQNQIKYLDADNKQLEHQVFNLREEVLNLRTLIIAHTDCPVAKQQRQQQQQYQQPQYHQTTLATTTPFQPLAVASSPQQLDAFELNCL